ncbi:T3SS effector HopA1 family protein [Streptomyces thinghirensis]|nr:T3SS effector HopA1 family protein [Streptomyces thinghirensis]
MHSTVFPRLGGPVRVPRLLNTYPEDRILEFEFVRDAQSLADRMTDARPLPGDCFPELGGFLGLLHALSPVSEPAVEDERAQMIGYERVSPEEFSLFSAAEIRVVRLVQSDRRLGLALTRLGRSLRPLGLLHGDFRAENVLVSRDDAGRLSVIDWELSRHSDPAAELGYFIGNLLHRAWYAVRAQRPDVESWQAAVDTRTAELSADTAAFWRGYLETAPERLTLRRPLLPLLVTAHAGSALLSRVVGDVRATGRVTPRDLLVIGRARDLVVHPASSARALLGEWLMTAPGTVLAPAFRTMLRAVEWRASGEVAVHGPSGTALVDGRGPRAAEELRRVLYEVFHAGRPVTGAVTDPDEEFLAGLAASVRVPWSLSPGWRVVTAGAEDEPSVEQYGVRVSVRADRHLAPGHRLVPGEVVTLRLPPCRPGLSPGFFSVIGSRGEPEGPLTRFYLNLPYRSVPKLVTALTEQLELRGVVYAFKTLDMPAAYGRRDGTVLYARRRDRASAVESLSAALTSLPEPASTDVPPLTERVLPAVGAADEPGGAGFAGLSFGEHRCDAVARFLLDHHGRDATELVPLLAGELARRGIDPWPPTPVRRSPPRRRRGERPMNPTHLAPVPPAPSPASAGTGNAGPRRPGRPGGRWRTWGWSVCSTRGRPCFRPPTGRCCPTWV